MRDANPEQVRQAVLDSVAAGTLTDELVGLVHQMAAASMNRQMAEDCGQTVLLGLLRTLPRIDTSRDTFGYIASALRKTWQKHMRGRMGEYKYMLSEVNRLTAALPPAVQATARRQGRASGERVLAIKLKYF